MKTKNIIILSTCLLVAGIVAGWFIRKGVAERGVHETVVRLDTLVVRDTVLERHPVYVERTVTDTMLVALTDTVRVSDTVYVRLPREQRRYADTNYVAWVSGYRPNLDSIEVYPVTRYVTRTVYPTKKRSGMSVESSASWCGTWSLTLSLEYDYMTKWCYVGASVGYDVLMKSPFVAVHAGIPILGW